MNIFLLSLVTSMPGFAMAINWSFAGNAASTTIARFAFSFILHLIGASLHEKEEKGKKR
jgi:hypothetical protein